MSKKRQGKDRKKDQLADPSASSEQDDLSAFCSGVQIQEISFKCWKKQHSDLDLQYPLVIRRSELQLPYKTVIRLTRTIKDSGAQSCRVETRERFEHVLELDAEQLELTCIRVIGLGDRRGETAGDLLILLEIRD